MVVNRLTQNEQVVWLLLLCTLIFFPGFEAEARKSAAGTMAKLDGDGDGKISKDEWRKKRIFHSVDLNGDGYVSLEELEIRFGEKTADADSDTERPDRKTISAIRRAGFDDVQDLKDLGLFETGLHPTWGSDVECHSIDEWYAKDYTPKRPKESYHGGIDIPAPFGTPTHAVMGGEVVAVYAGDRNPRGIEVVIRHTPEESGFPLYIYTRYTHFDRMPEVKIGQRLKMGDVIGAIGNSGIQGCELTGRECRRSRRPGLHFDVLYTKNEKYYDTGAILIPFEARWMDPNALYRKRLPVDSQTLRALPDQQKAIPISYMLESGELVPADTKMIWPYPCKKVSSSW